MEKLKYLVINNMNLCKILKKIEKLELNIVSHGGVSSNYIVEYFLKNNITTILKIYENFEFI